MNTSALHAYFSDQTDSHMRFPHTITTRFTVLIGDVYERAFEKQSRQYFPIFLLIITFVKSPQKYKIAKKLKVLFYDTENGKL